MASSSLDIVHRWRWGEDLTDDRVIDQSWAENGKVEPASEGEVHFYAIRVRLGRQYLWNFDTRTHSVTGSPMRDRLALETLYTTRDGTQAVVHIWEANKQSSGDDDSSLSVCPTSDFHSVLARSPDQDTVPNEEAQVAYAKTVKQLYGSE